MSTARQVLSNTASQIIGKVITALIGIISIKLITNYLSTSAYGEYTAIYDYTAIFAIIADFGLFTIAVREMAHDEKKISYILGNILSIRTLLAFFALGFGILVAFFVPAYRGSMIPLGVVVVSISVLLTLVAGTISSVLQIYLKMHWSAFALVIGKIVTVAYIVFTISYLFPKNPEEGFLHLLYAWIIGTALTIFLTYLPSRQLAKIRYRFDFDFWKEVIFKALPYGAALLLGSLYFRTGTVVMSFFGQNESVGIYGVAVRFIEIAVIIPAFFMNSILPILTRNLQEASEKVKKILQYSFDFMALAAFPVVAGGVVLAKPLIAGLSSDAFVSRVGFVGSDVALTLLLFGMAFTFFHSVSNFTLVAMGLQRKVLYINFFAALLNITANIIFIPKYSFVAVGIIAVATELFILICGYYLLGTILKFHPRLVLAAKALLASLLMAFIVGFLDPRLRAVMELKSLFLLIPLGALFYFATLIFLRTFTPEMIEILFKKKEKEVVSDQISGISGQ